MCEIFHHDIFQNGFHAQPLCSHRALESLSYEIRTDPCTPPALWRVPGDLPKRDRAVQTGSHVMPDVYIMMHDCCDRHHDGAGERGPRGPPGYQGSRGPQGPKGIKGIKGLDGPQGFTGPAGQTGDVGPPGPIGRRGREGPRGDEGPIGKNGRPVSARLKICQRFHEECNRSCFSLVSASGAAVSKLCMTILYLVKSVKCSLHGLEDTERECPRG